jgi:hypothetical protein
MKLERDRRALLNEQEKQMQAESRAKKDAQFPHAAEARKRTNARGVAKRAAKMAAGEKFHNCPQLPAGATISEIVGEDNRISRNAMKRVILCVKATGLPDVYSVGFHFVLNSYRILVHAYAVKEDIGSWRHLSA